MPESAITLFKVYCAIMTVMYALICVVAVAIPLAGLDLRPEEMVGFAAAGIVSFPLMLAFGYGLFIPRAKWAWVFGVMLIGIGLSSCCFWPICIPLLIKWFDAAFKAWFESAEPA